MNFKVGDKVIISTVCSGRIVGAYTTSYLVELDNQYKEDGKPRVVRCYPEHLMPDTLAGRVLFGKPKSKFF